MLGAALLAASLALTTAQSKTIDTAVEQVMAANHIPRLSIGVARKGNVLLLRGYGSAHGDTIYRIGSLTKQFTAALVLQQIERGTLALTTSTHGVTVQQLLAQTSGLPTYTDDPRSVEAALGSQPLFEPGTQFEYSNTNYFLLGSLVESATHMPLATLLYRNIAAPLGLRNTSLSVNDASAGMSSTAADLLTWLEALRSGRVVSNADFQAMTASQALPSGERTHYGYGFYIRDWYGWKTAEHPGYVEGFSADDAIVIDDGLEIAVLANAGNAYLLPIAKTIAQALERPRDGALVADFEHPAQNENPAVTRDVVELVHELQRGSLDRDRLTTSLNKTLSAQHVLDGGQPFSALGALTLVEFINRTSVNGTALEKYRLSFGYKQFWMTLSYAPDGKIDTLTITPDDD